MSMLDFYRCKPLHPFLPKGQLSETNQWFCFVICFSLALLSTEFRLNCVPCRPPPSTRVRKSQLAWAVYL